MINAGAVATKLAQPPHPVWSSARTGWGGWASFVATAPALIIQTDGSTSLAELVNQYFLYAAGGTSGPELQLYGADVVAGTLGGWTPIGAVKTAGGYEVAFKLPGTNLFTVWNTDSNGNYTSDTHGGGIRRSSFCTVNWLETTPIRT